MPPLSLSLCREQFIGIKVISTRDRLGIVASVFPVVAPPTGQGLCPRRNFVAAKQSLSCCCMRLVGDLASVTINRRRATIVRDRIREFQVQAPFALSDWISRRFSALITLSDSPARSEIR